MTPSTPSSAVLSHEERAALRDRCHRERMKSRELRARSIPLLWRARRQVFDHYGLIRAMVDMEGPVHHGSLAAGDGSSTDVRHPNDVSMTEFALTAIDRLYQVGVVLAGVRNRLGPCEEESRLASAMCELDLIGRGIRACVFESQSPPAV